MGSTSQPQDAAAVTLQFEFPAMPVVGGKTQEVCRRCERFSTILCCVQGQLEELLIQCAFWDFGNSSDA